MNITPEELLSLIKGLASVDEGTRLAALLQVATVPAKFLFKDIQGMNYTYGHYVASGWSEEEMIQRGILTPIKAEAPSSTAIYKDRDGKVIAPPEAGSIIPSTVPDGYTFSDGYKGNVSFTYENYRSVGWSDDQLIKAGFLKRIDTRTRAERPAWVDVINERFVPCVGVLGLRRSGEVLMANNEVMVAPTMGEKFARKVNVTIGRGLIQSLTKRDAVKLAIAILTVVDMMDGE